MVVYTRSTSVSRNEYRELAEEIAGDRDEAVVSERSMIDPSETVYYVEDPTMISPDTLSHLLETRIENPPHSVNFGLITGRTPAEARDLYYRGLEECDGENTATSTDDPIDYIFDRETDKSPTTSNQRSQVLTNEALTSDTVRDVFDGYVRSLSAVLHGKHMYARLEDGFLSGFPSAPEEFIFNPPQPVSVNTDVEGDPQLKMDGDVVLADTLEASYVFLDGCSAIPVNMNNRLDDPVHLGLSLLSNVRTLIGTFRITECSELHGTLHHKLVRAGYSAAERAYLLNRSAATAGVDAYPYVVAGHPSEKPDQTAEQQYEVSVESDGPGYLLRCTDVDTPLMDIRIPDGAKGSESDTWFVRRTRPTPSRERDHYYTAFREGSDLRVVVFSWDRLHAEDLTYEVSPARSLHDDHYFDAQDRGFDTERPSQLPRVPEVITGLEDHRFAGLLTKEEGAIDAIRKELTRVNETLQKERFNTVAHFDTADQLQSQAEKLWGKPDELGGLRAVVVEEVLGNRAMGALQENIYNSPPMEHTEGTTVNGGCPYCDGRAYKRTRTDAFGSVSRTLGICANCAYIFDVPGDGEDPSFPRIHGDLYGATDEIDVTARFTNPLDHDTEAVFVFAVSDNRVSGSDIVDDPIRVLDLPVHERASTTFTVDIGRLADAVTPDADVEVDVEITDYRYIGQNRICGGDGDVVSERLEAIGQSDPTRLEGNVELEYDGETQTVPAHTYEANVRESQKKIYGDDGFVTIEVHVVSDTLSVFSGMRTLYPDPSVYE